MTVQQLCCPQVEDLLSNCEKQGKHLTYSHSLRFVIQHLSCLLHLADDLQYWRVEVAVAEAKQAHPAPPQGEQGGTEAETTMQPGGVRRRHPTPSKEEVMGAEPASQAKQGRRAGQRQPQSAATSALERCRALLADLVQLRSRDRAVLESRQALRTQQHGQRGQVESLPQPEQQQGPGRIGLQQQLQQQQQQQQQSGPDEAASGSQAKPGGLAAGLPLSAEDADLLMSRLEAVSLQSRAAEALRDLVMLTGKGVRHCTCLCQHSPAAARLPATRLLPLCTLPCGCASSRDLREKPALCCALVLLLGRYLRL